jgi:hypothetical protein
MSAASTFTTTCGAANGGDCVPADPAVSAEVAADFLDR